MKVSYMSGVAVGKLSAEDEREILVLIQEWCNHARRTSGLLQDECYSRVRGLYGVLKLNEDINGVGKIHFGKFLKKVWHDVKHIAAAPGRDAFLGLIELNVHGLATHLAEGKLKDENGLHHLWTDTLGGNFSTLSKAIDNGKKKKKLLGLDGIERLDGQLTGLYGLSGDEPIGIVVATALALSAPIILAVTHFLKAAGVKGDTVDNAAAAATDAYNAVALADPSAGLPPIPDVTNPAFHSRIIDKGKGVDHSHGKTPMWIWIAGGVGVITIGGILFFVSK